MEKLLQEWNLESLIPVFAQNEINLDNITLLSDDQIKELIPRIGVRLKFINNLKEYKNKLHKHLDIESLPLVFSNELQEINVQSPSTSSETASDSNTIAKSQFVVVPTYNRAVAFCGIDDLLVQRDKMPDFDLNTLLSLAPYGSLVLNYYAKNEILNDYMRNKLVHIIIRNLYSYVMKL